jgi:hypothetical protein
MFCLIICNNKDCWYSCNLMFLVLFFYVISRKKNTKVNYVLNVAIKKQKKMELN